MDYMLVYSPLDVAMGEMGSVAAVCAPLEFSPEIVPFTCGLE